MNDNKYEVFVPKSSELPENDILGEKDILPTSFGQKYFYKYKIIN